MFLALEIPLILGAIALTAIFAYHLGWNAGVRMFERELKALHDKENNSLAKAAGRK